MHSERVGQRVRRRTFGRDYTGRGMRVGTYVTQTYMYFCTRTHVTPFRLMSSCGTCLSAYGLYSIAEYDFYYPEIEYGH